MTDNVRQNKPRTWTLTMHRRTTMPVVQVKPDNECSFTDEELIPVIELEPVLRLLQRHVRINVQSNLATSVDRDSEALLREHGRLG